MKKHGNIAAACTIFAVALLLQFLLLNSFEAGRRHDVAIPIASLIVCILTWPLAMRLIVHVVLRVVIFSFLIGVFATCFLLALEISYSPKASLFSAADFTVIFAFTFLLTGGWIVGLVWSLFARRLNVYP
jgi:hypothetical protein